MGQKFNQSGLKCGTCRCGVAGLPDSVFKSKRSGLKRRGPSCFDFRILAEHFGAAQEGGAGMEAEEISVWPFLSRMSAYWYGVKRMRSLRRADKETGPVEEASYALTY